MVGWFELCFEFRFFIGRGDRRCAVSKLGKDVTINDVGPFAASSRVTESLGAAFVAVIDASLLDLHPVVAETSAQEMRLSDVILGGYE
jgi:hypothetical protein